MPPVWSDRAIGLSRPPGRRRDPAPSGLVLRERSDPRPAGVRRRERHQQRGAPLRRNGRASASRQSRDSHSRGRLGRPGSPHRPATRPRCRGPARRAAGRPGPGSCSSYQPVSGSLGRGDSAGFEPGGVSPSPGLFSWSCPGSSPAAVAKGRGLDSGRSPALPTLFGQSVRPSPG